MQNTSYRTNERHTDFTLSSDHFIEVLYGLDKLRRSLTSDEWKAFCREHVYYHQIHEVLLEDCLTRKAFESRVVFEDNAVLLDYLLGYQEPQPIPKKALAKSIFNFLLFSDPVVAIRHRRDYIARLLDDKANQSSAAVSVLSMGAGHVREADVSTAFDQYKIKRFIAYDWEASHLSFVKNAYARLGIVPLKGTLNELFTDTFPLGKYDFIYAPSVLNYVDEKVARQLIYWMFDALQDRGSMLLCHFREEVSNSIYRTYMEAFMGWYMQYRTDADIIDLCSDIDQNLVHDFQFTTDPLCNIAYILISRG